jgi:hypothetical protein
MNLLPTQADLNAYLKNLRDGLVEIIGTDLGKYQIYNSAGQIISEIPAIAVEPPPFKTNLRKMKANSGIECIISRTGKPSISHLLGNNQYFVDYCLRLTQYNTNASTQLAVSKIVNSGKFFIIKEPVFVPFTELQDMYVYENCEISIRTYMVVKI